MARGIPRRGHGDESVGPEKLTESLRRARFFEQRFGGVQVNAFVASPGYGNPTGTVNVENVLDTGKYLFPFAWVSPSTDATILAPVINTEGYLDLGGDQELAHGIEILFGSAIATALCPRNFTMGTDQPFIRGLFNIEDASGVDLYFGFRKCEAFAGAIATYTDVCAIRVLGDSSSAAAAVSVVTNLNDATDPTSTAITSHTVADATDFELEVFFRGRSAYFRLDGAELKPVVSFTADSADIYTPFLFLLNTTDLGGKVQFLAVQGGPDTELDRPDALLSA